MPAAECCFGPKRMVILSELGTDADFKICAVHRLRIHLLLSQAIGHVDFYHKSIKKSTQAAAALNRLHELFSKLYVADCAFKTAIYETGFVFIASHLNGSQQYNIVICYISLGMK